MDYRIKEVQREEINDAFSLIWTTFSEFVAPDYTKEAVDNFKSNFIDSIDYREKFLNGQEVMFGAYDKDKLIGVLSVRGSEFISCVFVDKRYHRKGVAGSLFSHVIPKLKEDGMKKLRLNSSPYAVPFYHSIGFKDFAPQQVYQGILFTPMELILEK
ncbi:MAG: GNAT family N-acetyltransferase [Clostridium sp.]|nr:GNAT family N-acetyltransferase [Clostridium sp.]MDU7084907.1 GNAT family N-acetyltransferase [Clostridium sp.]